jgi:hypothetical protein
MEWVCVTEIALPSSHGAPMQERGVSLSLIWENGVVS